MTLKQLSQFAFVICCIALLLPAGLISTADVHAQYRGPSGVKLPAGIRASQNRSSHQSGYNRSNYRTSADVQRGNSYGRSHGNQGRHRHGPVPNQYSTYRYGNNRSRSNTYFGLNQGGLTIGSFGRGGGLSINIPLGGNSLSRYGGPGLYSGYGGPGYGGYSGYGGYGGRGYSTYRAYSVPALGIPGYYPSRPSNYGGPDLSGPLPGYRGTGYSGIDRLSVSRDIDRNPYLDNQQQLSNGLAGRGSSGLAGREPSGLVRSYKPAVGTTGRALIATVYDAQAYQIRAEAAFRNGDYRTAAQLSNEALQADNENGLLMLFASQANFASGYYAQSANEIESAARFIGDSQLGYVVKNFERFYGRDDYVSQMDNLKRHITRNPGDHRALTLRGFQYGALGYPDAASQDFKAALAVKPDYSLAARLDNALGQGTLLPSTYIQQPMDENQPAPIMAPPQNFPDYGSSGTGQFIDNPTIGNPDSAPPVIGPAEYLPDSYLPDSYLPETGTLPETGAIENDYFLPSNEAPRSVLIPSGG